MSGTPSKSLAADSWDLARPLRLLIIEHERPDVELILQELKKAGFKLRADLVQTLEEVTERLNSTAYDVILADYRLPGWTGLDALAVVRHLGKDIPILLVTGMLGEEAAVECLKQGVSDYVLKGRLARLPVAVRRALQEKALREERARFEQALRESESSFRLLFANNPLPMWVFDAETLRFLQVNDVAVVHYGYTREEFLQMRISDIRPGDARQPVQSMAKGTPEPRLVGQWRHRVKDGRIIDVEINAHRLDFAGREAVLAVAQDITDRKRAEEALRESEERYRTVAETATDAIMIVDDAGCIQYANPATEGIFGYSAAQLLGQELTLLIPARLQNRHRNSLKRYVETGRKQANWHAVQFPGLHKTGREIPLEISYGEFIKDGKRVFTGIIRDITERKQAEEALQESEARHHDLVKNAIYGIYRTTPEGKFLDANPALVNMLGYGSEEELLTLDLDKDVYRDPSVRARLLEQAISQGRVEGREVQWRRKDGSTVLVLLSGRAVHDVQGNMAYFEGIAEDVTEQRGLENQLRQVHKFQAIGQLAGGIAHDFNNVIGAILGWAELGLDQTPADTLLHSHFKKIREQARRAAGLIRQLLAFARRQILEPQDLQLNQIVSELLSLLEKVIGKDIELKTVLAPNLGVVRADPGQVEQVLMNLCLNARDAMPRGGQLLIETRNMEIDEEYCRAHAYAHPGGYVLLSVTDNGMGMDSATLEHIFEPFFTTKGIGKGTGLGLATVYGVVKQHGGFLHVYSEPGRGSTFRVYLPFSHAVPEKVDSQERAASVPVRGGTETILMAEDHDGVREMARETLEGLGYRVMLAGDGEEAVRMFEAHCDRVALVLLDVVMPKLGGREAYAKMCAITPNVPVIFTTGYSTEAALLGAMVEKGLVLLQKPYGPALLGCKVREALDSAANAAASPVRSSGR